MRTLGLNGGDTLNAVTDLVVYTYYPFQPASDFQHRPPSTFEPDMSAMLAHVEMYMYTYIQHCVQIKNNII